MIPEPQDNIKSISEELPVPEALEGSGESSRWLRLSKPPLSKPCSFLGDLLPRRALHNTGHLGYAR